MLALLGDIGDIKGDKHNNKNTLPIIIGIKPTLLIVYLMPVFMIIHTSIIKEAIGISIYGFMLLISVFVLFLFIVYPIKKNWSKPDYVHTSRYKLRYASIILQVSLMITMTNII